MQSILPVIRVSWTTDMMPVAAATFVTQPSQWNYYEQWNAKIKDKKVEFYMTIEISISILKNTVLDLINVRG